MVVWNPYNDDCRSFKETKAHIPQQPLERINALLPSLLKHNHDIPIRSDRIPKFHTWRNLALFQPESRVKLDVVVEQDVREERFYFVDREEAAWAVKDVC
jgi:hypothetical protein